MISKLAIGTVQFGLDYGISNDNGEVGLYEIDKILKKAAFSGINVIDTAKSYGTSEAKLGKFDLSDFNVISKVTICDNFQEEVEDSLQKLNISKLYGLLIHDFNGFISNDGIYNQFVKSEYFSSHIKKIGFSLNKVAELDYLLLNKIEFNIIQIPYNLLDRRFQPYFNRLAKMGVEIHSRSSFLQGLFFMDNDNVPSYLNKLLPSLEKIKKLSLDNNISIEAIALNFPILNPFIDKVVIGVTDIGELEANIDALMHIEKVRSLENELYDLALNDENLVLPMNWNNE